MKTWVVASTFLFLGSCLFFLHRSKLPFRMFSCKTELGCGKKTSLPNCTPGMQGSCANGNIKVSSEQKKLMVSKEESVNSDTAKQSLLAKNNAIPKELQDDSNPLELITKEFDINKEHTASRGRNQKKYQKKKTIVLEKSKSKKNNNSVAVHRRKESNAPQVPTQNTVLVHNSASSPTESQAPRVITIRNRLSPEMTTYKHWTGDYTPALKVFVDQAEVPHNQEKKITVSQNQIAISYQYDFMKGIRKGSDNVAIDIPAEGTVFDINFSWDSKPRITLSSISA